MRHEINIKTVYYVHLWTIQYCLQKLKSQRELYNKVYTKATTEVEIVCFHLKESIKGEVGQVQSL